MNNKQEEIIIKEIEYNSNFYKESLNFRFRILRAPLGLEWSGKDLDGEDKQFHIVAIYDEEVVGSVVLKPISQSKIKLRQMAVDEAWQGSGIGRKLVEFAESLARSKSFKTIEMIARISALEFYKKLGYDAKGNEFEEVTVRSINMSKSLLCSV